MILGLILRHPSCTSGSGGRLVASVSVPDFDWPNNEPA